MLSPSSLRISLETDSNVKKFKRQFLTNDIEIFQQLTNGLVGEVCRVWRRSYGRTGSLHFGPLRSISSERFSPYHEEGTWILRLWDCDRRLSLPGESAIDNRETGDDAQFARFNELEGLTVDAFELDSETLDLSVRFAGGAELVLVVDERCQADGDQWTLNLPSRRVIVSWPRRRWGLIGLDDAAE